MKMLKEDCATFGFFCTYYLGNTVPSVPVITVCILSLGVIGSKWKITFRNLM